MHPYVERIVSHLLMMAASDVDAAVRRSTIECLLSAFDARKLFSLRTFFTHADAVAAIALCLNDVVPGVRLAALTITGRVSRLNPAAATPVLRRYLEQLLTDIEYCADSRRLDDSTMLLAEMIHQVRALVAPASACLPRSDVACSVRRKPERGGAHLVVLVTPRALEPMRPI